MKRVVNKFSPESFVGNEQRFKTTSFEFDHQIKPRVIVYKKNMLQILATSFSQLSDFE